MVKIELKPVLAAERDTFKALARSIWLPTFRSYFNPDELLALFEGMYEDQALDAIFDSPEYELFFLHCPELGHSPVGYLGVEWEPDALRLDKLYIRTDLRGSGIGTQVMDTLTGWARQKQLNTIVLRVNIANSSAIAFYKRHGFSVSRMERIPGPDGYVYHDYWMTKQMDF